ncbi:MAG: MGMT family protein [Thiothrix sp.]|nr:MAG: MGMT family protein [Thiothrix sp.]
MPKLSKQARIYAVVKQIPFGSVSTYGDIAKLAGLARHARLVGYSLHALPDQTEVPWHRVVNSQGQLSLGKLSPAGASEQRERLLQEGVEFNALGRVLLKQYRWQPHPLEWEAFIINLETRLT